MSLALPESAESQISGHVVSAPKFGSEAQHSSPPKEVKRPVQADIPPPPPTIYVPGLSEPFIAMGPVSDEETKELNEAAQEFQDIPLKMNGGDFADFAKPLEAFVTAHKGSNWNPSILTDLGIGYVLDGYYSRAFTDYEQAWEQGKDAANPQAHLLMDRTIGELIKMHARVGHADQVEALLTSIKGRPIGGPATEMIQGAREGLWAFHHNPGLAYLCGPHALRKVMKVLGSPKKQIETVMDARSGPHGFSLTQLAALADKAKFKYRLIHREPGQPIPVPSIINWNIHHYAAIVGMSNGYYLVDDPTFGNATSQAVTERAINQESSGYFLVPAEVADAQKDAGWRTISAKSDEAKSVYGMGDTNGSDDFCTACFDKKMKSALTLQNNPFEPMTVANAHTMTVSLNLTDTPVGYRPQIGLPNLDQVTYNSREVLQPTSFSFGNLSGKWLHSWQSFILDNPGSPGANVTHYNTGGGSQPYSGSDFNPTTGTFTAETPNQAVLKRVPASGTLSYYELDMPDGSYEKYAQSNGATGSQRLIFLTDIYDAQGNHTQLHYQNVSGTHNYYIDYVQDAMGRQTTFTYAISGHPLLISKITDPFGRYASFTYDSSARLASITDPAGITSSFTYSTTETTFVTSLTTPYGTSNFDDTINSADHAESNTRALRLIDPLGNTDYLYFYQYSQTPPITPHSDTYVPSGMNTGDNGDLEWRNTYYWNRHAFAQCTGAQMPNYCDPVTDEGKSEIFHWLHDYVTLHTGRVWGSTKKALEYRVWYNYPNMASQGHYSGTYDAPTYIGRVLDGTPGATQLSAFTYNSLGFPLTATDPKGRETSYTYDTNNIDLLTVKQLTAPSTFTTIASYGSYSNHLPQTYTGPDGQTWNYTYTSAGQLKTVTDPNSHVTTWNYDTSGRLSTIVDANTTTILTLTYDSADRVHTRTDSQGYTLTYAYDNLDRITSITYPDSTTDQYDYTFQSGTYAGTASLELRKYTDRLGRVTTYNYDADRRLTSVVEPTTSSTTRTTSYSYYEDGTLKEITDANGNVTHYDIDIESRPIDKIYAYGTSSAQTETYTWESNGGARLHSITDALGQVKTFSYDTDDRITGLTYTSTVNATPNVTFTWDTYFPRLSSMTDGLGTTNYSYTAIGSNGALKLSSIDGPYSNDTISLTYDAIGRLSGRNISGGNETFGYDAINRLTSHGTPLGSFTIGYLGETDQIASQSVTNGSVTVSTSWSYDTNTNDRRLTGITNSGVSRSYSFGYGSSPVNVYDIMSITDTAATGHPWSTQTHSYTNDYADRLLTETVTTPGNSTFAYDNLDNATTWNTPASGSLSPTFNGLNQLHTFGPNTYSYDADGNTLSGDGTRTYKWDAENRLIEIDYVGTSNKSVFSYDALGRRTVDQETVSGTTTTTRYLWCGSRICQTRDGSDTVLRRDVWEGEYNASTSQKLVYMPDQLGSVRDVIDASTGNLVQSYDYTPYGAVARSNGSTPTDYRYAGLFYHPNSGLNLAAYRVQDGNTGRWLSRDPIREFGGINLYGYVAARPTLRTDHKGLEFGLGGGGIYYPPVNSIPPWASGLPRSGMTPAQREDLSKYLDQVGNYSIYGSFGMLWYFPPGAPVMAYVGACSKDPPCQYD